MKEVRATGGKRRIDREKIKVLYEKGLLIPEIANEMHCNVEYLRRIICDEMGLEPPKTDLKPSTKQGGFSLEEIEAWSKEWDEVRFTVRMRLRTNYNKTKVMEDYERRIRKNGLI